MCLTKKSTFTTINSEIKTVLAELDELVTLNETTTSSEEIEKNNAIILETLDQLLELIHGE